MPAVTVPIAAHPRIPEQGVKGFLKWMKIDPVLSRVYTKIKPQLDQMIGAQAFGYFGDDSGLLTTDYSLPTMSLTDATSGIVAPSVSIPEDSVTANAPTSSSGSSAWLSSLSSLISEAGQ